MKGNKGVVRRISPTLDEAVKIVMKRYTDEGIPMRYTDASDILAKRMRRDKK